MFGNSARQMNLASGKHSLVGLAEVLEQERIHKRRESEMKRRNCTFMYCLGYAEDASSLGQSISRPVENQLTSGSGMDSVTPIANQQWKSKIRFERLDLVADGGLRALHVLCGLAEILPLGDCYQILQ